jgi:hypothetical protein
MGLQPTKGDEDAAGRSRESESETQTSKRTVIDYAEAAAARRDSFDDSPASAGYTIPANAAPTMGATQNSQSWSIAQPPTNIAGPVLRAGLTERLVTGIPMRWINVSPRPMAMGAKPCGARRSVAPRMMARNMKVSTTSAVKHAVSEYPPGE